MRRIFPFLLLFVSCATPLPKPAAVTAPIAAAPAEVSTLVIPIEVSLAPLLPLIEAQVPKSLVKTDVYELDPQRRFGMKYKVQRDPIALKMQGAGLHASTTVHYAIEGCSRTKNPISGAFAMWPCISCGFNQPMRDAEIELQSRLAFGADWTLRSTTTPRPVQFPNRCAVTVLNIDITDWKLGPLVNQQLKDLAHTIDGNTPKMTSLRPVAQQIWTSLQAPYEIAPRTWLVLEPLDVALAPMRGSGLQVSTALTLHARTRVVVGEKPRAAATALPQLVNAEANGSGVRIPFDLDIPYDEASRLLTQQFGRQTYKSGGSTLAVESIRVSHGESGRLDVEASIDFNGGGVKRYRGLVYLDGMPQFDPANGSITIPDLRYRIDPKRKNPFLRTLDRLAHDEVEKRLREGARWSIASQLTASHAEVERALTRQLAPEVSLRGRVDAIEPRAIIAAPNAITVRIVVTGAAQVDVKNWR